MAAELCARPATPYIVSVGNAITPLLRRMLEAVDTKDDQSTTDQQFGVSTIYTKKVKSPILNYEGWAQSWSRFLGSQLRSARRWLSHKPSGSLTFHQAHGYSHSQRDHPLSRYRCKELAHGHYATVPTQDLLSNYPAAVQKQLYLGVRYCAIWVFHELVKPVLTDGCNFV